MNRATTELRQAGPTHVLHHHTRRLGLPQHLHEAGTEAQLSRTPHAVNRALAVEDSLSGMAPPHQVPRWRCGFRQGEGRAGGRAIVRRWRALRITAPPAVTTMVLPPLIPLPRPPAPTAGTPLAIRLLIPAGTTAITGYGVIPTPPPRPFPRPILGAAFAVPDGTLVRFPPGAPLSRPGPGPWAGTLPSLGASPLGTMKRGRGRHESELGRSMVNPPGLLATPLHELGEASKVVIGIMGTGAGLRVVLDPEDGPPL